MAFVVIVLATWSGLCALPLRWPDSVGYVTSYTMGSLAVFWFLQRVEASLAGMIL